jgi:hypothetical protein
MKWYGEPMDDFKVKVPKSLPPYTEDSDIEKLFAAIENKDSRIVPKFNFKALLLV